jgi:hypothetical protein
MNTAKHCMLREDYDESCESEVCPQKQLWRRLKRDNDLKSLSLNTAESRIMGRKGLNIIR